MAWSLINNTTIVDFIADLGRYQLQNVSGVATKTAYDTANRRGVCRVMQAPPICPYLRSCVCQYFCPTPTFISTLRLTIS